MQIQPYLHFEGRADEAIEFYKKALGATVNMLMRYKDCPEEPNCDSGNKFPAEMLDKVMHASLKIGDSTLLISDGRCQGPAKFSGFSLPVLVQTDADAKKYFAALSEGGTITMPIGKTFFSSQFGMLTDRFGVPWMVLVQQH
ncbi:MAG TPA: VOC family protein [Tepidisphaeraceae bacterium]|nr:VOC family protein [Tepidisphaeraceae bacterium]